MQHERKKYLIVCRKMHLAKLNTSKLLSRKRSTLIAKLYSRFINTLVEVYLYFLKYKYVLTNFNFKFVNTYLFSIFSLVSYHFN